MSTTARPAADEAEIRRRRHQNNIKAAYNRRQAANVGKLRCLCQNVAHRLSSCGPVCERCDNIESEMTHAYARDTCGSNRMRAGGELHMGAYAVCAEPA